MAEGKDNVKVAIRVRPLSEKERREMGAKTCVTAEKELSAIVLDARPEVKTFTFDYVADTDVQQGEIFEQVGKPLTSSCLSGYNGTIFAYGQTGAGKTYTILGPDADISLEDYENSPQFQDRGLMPRCVEHIFGEIGKERRQDVEYLVKASFLEIYQEQVIDLLSGSAEGFNLQLREDLKRGVYVEGLIEEIVGSIGDTYELLKTGTCNRHVGATTMNKESSRSHSVFTLTIESKEIREGVTNFRSSRFHIIDLAGSERQRSTDAIGERLREAGMINKSLSALGNVINSLVDIAEGKSRHVHYRDSKLTFLLKDSLGGNSKTFIVANISPSALSFGETLSTLKFAQRAKMIRNKAVVNEDTAGSVHLLKEEIKRLKEELSTAQEISLLAIQKCPNCAGRQVEHMETAEGSERMLQLERMMEVNTRLRVREVKSLEEQLGVKENYIKTLLVQVGKFEKKISNDKMVLKFRDSTIARFQAGSKGEESAELESAKQEITLLREQLEGNASAAKLFIENERLKEELSALHKELMEEPDSVVARLRENQDYTEQVMDWMNEDIEAREKAKAVYEDYKRYESGETVPDKVKSSHESALLELKLGFIDRIQQLTDQIETLQAVNAEIEGNSRKKLEQQAKRIEEMAAENAVLSRTCQEVMALHVQGEEGKEQSEGELEKLVGEVERLTGSLAGCKVDLEVRDSALLAAQMQAQTLTSQLAASLEAKTALQHEIDQLSSQLLAAQQESLSHTTEITGLQQDKSDLERSLRSEQSTVTSLQEKLEQKTAELTSTLQELEVAQENNRFMVNGREEVEAVLKDLRDEKDELEAVNEELTSTIQEQEDQITGLLAEKATLETMQTERTELVRLLEEAQSKVQELQTSKQIQETSENSEKLQLVQTVELKVKALEAVQSRVAELEQTARNAETLEKEAAALKERLQDREQVLVTAQSQIEELQLALQLQESEIDSEKAQLKESIEEKQEALSDAENSIAALEQVVSSVKATLGQEVTSLRDMLGSKELALATVQRQTEALQAQLTLLENSENGELASKEEALEAAENRVRELEQAVRNMEETLGQEAAALREFLADKEKALASANSRIDTLQQSLDSKQKALLTVQTQLQAVNTQASAQVKDLETDLLAEREQNTHLKQQHSDLLQENSKLQSTLQASQAAAVLLGTQMKQYITAASEQEQVIATLQLELKVMEGETTRLESELLPQKKRISDLESQYASEKLLWERDLQAQELALRTERETSSKDLDALTSLEQDRNTLELQVAELQGQLAESRAALRAKDSAADFMRRDLERLVEAEKAAKTTIVDSLEAEETLREEVQQLKSTLQSRSKEVDQLSDALSGAMRDVESLRSNLQEAHIREKGLFHTKSELEQQLQTLQEENQAQIDGLMDERDLLETTGREREKLYEEKTAALAEHIAGLQRSLEQYQQLLLTAEQRASDLACQQDSHSDQRITELQTALESAQAEAKSLREDNKAKLEILQNTNRNILSTRQEIEMWKKCIEEKNEALHQLRHALRKAEEEKTLLQGQTGKSKPCGHENELQYIKGVLERREKELFELKEKGQLYYAQADEAIESQRKEIDALNKRCAVYQGELAKCKEEMRAVEERRRHRSHESAEPSEQAKENDRSPLAKTKSVLPPRKDEVLLLKTQVVRLKEELSSKTEQIDALQQLVRAKGRTRDDEASLREHYEGQIESLSSGLNRITEYVFSLPIVSFNPEETGLVESTIKAIASVYESYEAKCREQTKARAQSEARAEPQAAFGTNYVNPANYKNPVAHYHALLNSSSIKPGQLLSPGQQRKSPLKTKKP